MKKLFNKQIYIKFKSFFWLFVFFLLLVILNFFIDLDLWINILLFIGFFFVMPIVRLIVNKDSFMPYVREIEKTMFSKPLDKTYWGPGELKKIKPKLVLKKKKKNKKLRRK